MKAWYWIRWNVRLWAARECQQHDNIKQTQGEKPASISAYEPFYSYSHTIQNANLGVLSGMTSEISGKLHHLRYRTSRSATLVEVVCELPCFYFNSMSLSIETPVWVEKCRIRSGFSMKKVLRVEMCSNLQTLSTNCTVFVDTHVMESHLRHKIGTF